MAHRSNRLLVLVLMLTWAAPLQAQTGEVQGRVHEAGTGDPLATVQVTLERGGAIIAGSVTDDDGRYRIDGVARGSYTLFARFIGFQTEQVAVEVGTEVLEVDLRLRAVVLDLDEVEVSAEAFQDESDPNVALTRITQEQVRQLPGGAEDVMRTLQATPGVQAPGDFSNQLIVRGGTPDQNLILLDEIEVYSPYQLSGMGSLLNPALVRQVDLYTGAFPAVYGDRLSSVLAVQTRDGATDRWLGGEVSTNMVSANLILEGKTGFLGGSWLVSGRRTYFDSFANTFAQRVGVFNDIAFPDFTDVQAKLMLRPAPGHFVRF
ncbi:MAG TPA: TonB-dependent receptor, partial [Rhodothermales bacterium]|nr:TonB-dependent receptor [Rhodothermales bacterium]